MRMRGIPNNLTHLVASITLGNITTLLDSGADANFAPVDIQRYFPNPKIERLKTPILAKLADQRVVLVDKQATILLPPPFNKEITCFLLPGLSKLIIGKPMLAEFHYKITPEAESITINGNEIKTNATQVMTALVEMNDAALKLFRIELVNYIERTYPKLVDTKPRPPIQRDIVYDIETTSDRYIQSKPYVLSFQEKVIVERYIKEAVDSGKWEKLPPNEKANLSPIFVVFSKVKPRVVNDYRAVNDITPTVAAFMPSHKDFVAYLEEKLVFTSIDLVAAYHQVGLSKRTLNAFAVITHIGCYRPRVIQFGMKNAPFFFQLFLASVLDDLPVFQYIDDILVATHTIDQNIELVKKVCHALNDAGLQVNPSKCSFLQTSISFLGFNISAGTIAADPKKMGAIQQWAKPRTVTEVRSFVGFCNFLRFLVPRLSHLLVPITELIHHKDQKNAPVEFTPEATAAFEKLKLMVALLPALQVYNEKKPTYIFTDALLVAIGAVVTQVKRVKGEDILVPVSFLSLKLTDTQSRYSTYEREMLAIICTLTRFKHLLGSKTTFFTDHQPILSLTKPGKEPATRIKRFASVLNLYDVEICYLPGHANYIADFLSRYLIETATEYVNEDEVWAKTDGTVVNPSPSVVLNAIRVDDLNSTQLERIEAKLRDTVARVPVEDGDYDELPLDQFTIVNDELLVVQEKSLVKVVDRDTYTRLATEVHNKFHASPRVTQYICSKVGWHPDHLIIIGNIILSCQHCQMKATFKHINRAYQPLEVVPAFKRWGMDFIGPMASTTNNRHCLNMVDYTTGLMYSIPCVSPSSDVVINTLSLICQVHGTPDVVVGDNGAAFTSSTTRVWCLHKGIQMNFASTYHPIANGRIERQNGLLKAVLRGLTKKRMLDWVENLPEAVEIVNGTPSVLGFSPYFLAMGINDNNKELAKYVDAEFLHEFEREMESTEQDVGDANQEMTDITMIRLYEIEAIMKARDKHNDLKTRRMAWINAMRTPFDDRGRFGKGDFVLRRAAKKFKNDPNYTGPFRITSVHDKNNYQITDLKGKVVQGTVHHDDLIRSYVFDQTPIHAMSLYKKSLFDMEKKILDKITDEISLQVVKLNDVVRNQMKVDWLFS